MRLGEGGVPLERFARAFAGHAPGAARRHHSADSKQDVDGGQARPRLRPRRLPRRGLAETADGLRHAVGVQARPEVPAAQVRLPGLEGGAACGPRARIAPARDLRPKDEGHLVGDLVVHGEDVVLLGLEVLGPRGMPVRRGTSCTAMRTRWPCRCTVPSRTASAPSASAASRGAIGWCAKCATAPVGRTVTFSTPVRAPMSASGIRDPGDPARRSRCCGRATRRGRARGRPWARGGGR